MKESMDMVAVVDLVIAITWIECGALVLYRRRTGKGVAVRDFLANMASGMCLMLALRCLASGGSSASIAGFLIAAGAAHFSDMAMRWRRAAPAQVQRDGVAA